MRNAMFTEPLMLIWRFVPNFDRSLLICYLQDLWVAWDTSLRASGAHL